MPNRKKLIYSFAVVSFLCLAVFPGSAEPQKKEAAVSEAGKKAVMIIAPNGFRDEELKEPREILKQKGIKVTVASTSLNPASGMLGASVKPEILLSELKVEDYDAVIFVGGVGAKQYWDDPAAHRIAREALKKNKVLGAICIAPVILANAGVLSGKKATVWKSEAKRIKEKGATYSDKPVELDGKIVTGSGPQAAKEFGQAIAQLLTEGEK
jgi:protease I